MEVQLTPNLKIVGIEANMWNHDEQGREVTTTFAIWFSYFEQAGFVAYLPVDNMNSDDASWALLEADCGELMDSFRSQLDEYWDEIKMACEKWEVENLELQTDS